MSNTPVSLPRIQTVRWIAATATFLTAVISFLYGPSRLEYPTTFHINQAAAVLDSFILAGIFYAAIGLIVGKRFAWKFAISALLIASIWDTIESKEIVTILSIFPILTLILLVVTRRYYAIATGKFSAYQLLYRAFGFALISTVIGCVAFFTLAGREHRAFDLTYSILESLRRMYSPDYLFMPVRQATSGHIIGHVLLPTLGILNYAVIAFALLQPAADRFRRTTATQRQVLDLLERYGQSSEDYFKYFPSDKSYYFGTDKEGFIAYKVCRGVCIALPDPIATNDKTKRALLGDFEQFCQSHGWQLAFLSVGKQSLHLYQQLDVKRIKIGENATVDLHSYITSPRTKNERNIINRFTKQHYTTQFVNPNNRLVMQELAMVSDSWLSAGGRKEWQFAMGYFEPTYLKESRIFVVRDNGGDIIAFANLQPNYTAKEHASIDLMRYRRDAPANVMDYLIMKLIEHLAAEKWHSLDLGLAALAGLEDSPELSERTLHLLVSYANRWYSFHGLRKFKDKFNPEWEERYLLYSGSTSRLALTARAINEALKLDQ